MAVELSARATLLSQKVNIEQIIALQVDGIPLIFGSSPIFRFWRIGDDGIVVGQDGLTIGGVIEREDSRAFVSLKGTTNNISQQIEVTEGGAGSIQSFTVQLIDKDQEVTKNFTPGQVVPDVLGRDAQVFVSFAGGSFPEDYLQIINGTVDLIESGPGFWRIRVAHPQQLTRVDLFEKIQTELTSDINETTTSIPVLSTSEFLLPDGENLRTAVLIDDEILEYTGVTSNSLTGVTRGVEGTVPATHDLEANVDTFYILEGTPLDLALKVMLSREENSFADEPITRIVRVNSAETIENGVIFSDSTLQQKLGLTVGDLVTITGSSTPGNNVIEAPIGGFQQTVEGTALVLSGVSLVEDTDGNAVATFRSQYDTLPVTRGGASAGANMKPTQVDVAQHLRLEQLFAASQPNYKIYLRDTIQAKDLITNELYKPAGYFQIPRNARYSVQVSIPPLALEDLKEFGLDAVKSPDSIRQRRTTNKYFFNNVTYRFNEDPLEEDKFLAGEVEFQQGSVNRIDSSTKSLTISSKGLRDDEPTRNFITRQVRRFADRYQFAAPQIKIQTKYKDGFATELGDIVLFGSADMQLPNEGTANRNTEPKLFEVINKSINLKTGQVQFTILDAGFGLDGRYGIVSPNSFLAAGSSTTTLFLKPSFQTGEFELERNKWTNLIGEDIVVRNEDFTFNEQVTLIAFDGGSLTGITIDPPLSVAPPEDYIVDLPLYPTNTNSDILAKMKNIHVFFTPQISVVGAPNDTSFEVAPADIGSFLVGAFVQVHSADFATNSRPIITDDDAEVTAVDTINNIVTVDRSLGFTPVNGDLVDLIGFADGGLPYRLI